MVVRKKPEHLYFAVLAGLLGTLVTGCGSDLTALTTDMAGDAVRNLEAGESAADSAPSVGAELKGLAQQAAFDQLLKIPEFAELLDAAGATPDQAEVVLQAWLEGGEAGPAIRSLAMGRLGQLATETMLSLPQVAALADQSGLEPDQVEQIVLALLWPDQSVGAVFAGLAEEELRGLTAITD